MRTLGVAVAIVILLAALKAAASIVVPLLVAIAIAVAFQPISDRLATRGIHPVVASVITTICVLAVLAGVGVITAFAARDLAEGAPRYAASLDTLRTQFEGWLEERRLGSVASQLDELEFTGYVGEFLRGAAVAASGVMAALLNVLILTAFIQVEAGLMRRKLELIVPARAVDRTMTAIGEVQKYLRVKFVLSVANGVLLGAWCWLWGVSNPLLWGVVAFAFNWVPLIGALIAAVPPVLLAIVEIGLGGALGVAAGYVVVNIAVDNVLEARLMGRAMDISPLVLMVSLLLWGFVLGPVGALLSVPLTVAVRIYLDHHEDLRWIALILANGTRGYENLRRHEGETSE